MDTVKLFVVVILMVMDVIASGWRVDGLNMNYYIMSCPFAEGIVKNTVNRALQDDPTLAAALLRMHFHDCFIQVNNPFSFFFFDNLQAYICMYIFVGM